MIKNTFTLDKAISLATQYHQGQKDRGGKPYIKHPLKVMGSLKDNKSKITGVLHDIVEDTPITFEDLEKLGCPDDVIEALRLVSHDDNFNGTRRSYLEEIKKIANSESQIAIDVKWADLTNNQDLSRIPNPTEKDFKRREKYQCAKDILRPYISQYLLDLS